MARTQTIAWNTTLLLIFFVIHMVRAGGNLSILGVITPFSAVLDDILVAETVANFKKEILEMQPSLALNK